METGAHDLSHLFRQLGLASDAVSIDAFLASHVLKAGQRLCDAPFWTPSQASLLAEALTQDAEWSEAADELATRLSAKAG